MAEVAIAPVRHHSPASAALVRGLIADRRPQLILIEGPADATPLIPLLADPATTPPVALYAYRTGAEGRAIFYPFCAYSPELVAIRDGLARGAEVRFCDVPASVSLDWVAPTEIEPGQAPLPSDADAVDVTEGPRYHDFAAALVEATGSSSFDEFWDRAFEQAASEPDELLARLRAFGESTRALDDPRRTVVDDRRERAMAGAALSARIPPDEIVLVCGAAHAAAIAEYVRADVAPPELLTTAPAEVALIPFSYPRLSEQSGYGAGNRAPWFYELVWRRRNDHAAAVRFALVAIAAELRRQGQVASLAQVIDAFSLARSLAALREKPGPGLDELQDAAVACLGQGNAGRVASALRTVLVGDAVGRVTQKVGKTPLQAEFYATAERLGIPILDAARPILVHLADPAEARQSVFFHRLAIANVPFATEVQSGLAPARRVLPGDDPLARLARVRERWSVQWSPATDGALVERTVWGNTLAEVGERLLRRRLDAATQVDQATEILLRLVLCDLADALPEALDRCEALAADSGSFPSLARAAYHLDGILAYGAARRLPKGPLLALAGRLFARAVLHLPEATLVADDAASEVESTLISLHEIVRRGSPVADGDSFWKVVARAVEAERCHAGMRGLCLTLLELAGHLASGQLASRLRFWLSRAGDAADNAKLVAGLFAQHRGTLVRNARLIGAVSEFLASLEIDALLPLLPTLRRTLGSLSPAERAYLEESLAAVLGLDRSTADAVELTEEGRRLARSMDAEVGRVLTVWRNRYGLG